MTHDFVPQRNQCQPRRVTRTGRQSHPHRVTAGVTPSLRAVRLHPVGLTVLLALPIILPQEPPGNLGAH